MKVLVATEKPFAKIAVDGIREVVEKNGYELALLEKYTDVNDLYKAVADADALIVRSDKVTKEVLDHANKLKIVVRAGAGYDNLDLEACTAKGVVAMNTPGQNSNAVAELVMGMLVTLIRNRYNGTSGTELLGKTLGIHAYGAVGRCVARIAKGFGMKISALDPWVKDEVMEADGIRPVHSVEELYSENQYVSLHIPATDETRGSVGKRLIEMLPKNGVLINAARKEVIDEAGLAEAMESRPDFRYVADVKPANGDELEAKYPERVLFTPKKMGAQTAEANINAGLAAANQVVAHLKDGWNRFQVNK